MRKVSGVLAITALTLSAGILSLHMAGAQKGHPSRFHLVALDDFTAYKGGVLVQEQRVVVYEQLSKIYDGRSRQYVIVPEDDERAAWSGEEYREITYDYAEGRFELSRKRLARESQVPAGILETGSCDRNNRLMVPIDPSIAALLPKNVLIKHVASIPYCNLELLGVVYADPSPPESTSDYAIWLAVIDRKLMRAESFIELHEYMEFCGMTVADVTGDALPEITLYGYSQGGSGYSKTARVYGLEPPDCKALNASHK